MKSQINFTVKDKNVSISTNKRYNEDKFMTGWEVNINEEEYFYHYIDEKRCINEAYMCWYSYNIQSEDEVYKATLTPKESNLFKNWMTIKNGVDKIHEIQNRIRWEAREADCLKFRIYYHNSEEVADAGHTGITRQVPWNEIKE